MELPVDLEFDVLVLHEGEKRLLGHDPADIGGIAHPSADLVDLVDEDDSSLHRSDPLRNRGARHEPAGVLEETSQNYLPVTLSFFRQNVGVDPNHIGEALELQPAAEKLLDGSHE